MRAIPRRAALAVLAVGAIGFAAACGGSDDSDAGLSADEFRQQADAICAKYDSEIDALGEPQSADELGTFLAKGIDVQERQIAELEALDAPEDLSGQFDEATGLLQAQVDLAQKAVDDIDGGTDPTEAVQTLTTEAESNGDRLDQLASDLGLTKCGDSDDDEDMSTTEGSETTATTLTDPAEPLPTDTEATDTTASDTGDAEGTTTYGDDSLQVYITDVSEAANALVQFGTILQNVSSPDQLESEASKASAQLDAFDEAMAKLGTYRLSNAKLEEQRAGLVATSGEVSSTLRDFVSAASEGDLSAAQALIPQVTSALSAFQTAAAGSSATTTSP